MKNKLNPSRQPSTDGYSLPSRTARRKSLRRRLLRYWREALAAVFVIVVVATVIIVVSNREEESAAPEPETWMDRIQVSGAVGRIPTLSLSGPVSVASSKMIQLETGTGREITPESPLIISITSFDGQTGQLLSSGGRARVEVGSANATDFDPTLLEGVVGKTEGSRVLFARPVAEGDGTKTELNVVDIMHSAASGEAVEDPGKPLTVKMTDTGPSITHPDEAPPSTLTVQTLVRGDGQQVQAGDNVLVQYVSASWENAVVHESTWWTGVPQVLTISTAMPGVRIALLDQRVGTRVAITIPPELASGDSTLTMVVDIIATEPEGGTLTPTQETSEEPTS
ncbi:MAG: peptidylprolyl isomerase [Actinomycetaceae bacterium]|nr:peptidylprolyl isomerase [Actinomycetaceae bacterium]